MATSIKVTTGKIHVKAELNDSPTAASIAAALPIQSKARRWGGEIYFSIPISADLAPDCREVLQDGELAFWPTGNAFCIFFGPTPASQGDDIRAASAVNIIGKMKGDWSGLWEVQDGERITVETA